MNDSSACQRQRALCEDFGECHPAPCVPLIQSHAWHRARDHRPTHALIIFPGMTHWRDPRTPTPACLQEWPRQCVRHESFRMRYPITYRRPLSKRHVSFPALTISASSSPRTDTGLRLGSVFLCRKHVTPSGRWLWTKTGSPIPRLTY